MSSLYSFFDRKILFPLAEKFNRSSSIKNYYSLLKTDWYSREQLLALQNKKLSDLITHCYNKVPYYKELFDSLHIGPDDIKSKKDLQKIPILTKQIIRENYNKIISGDLANRKVQNHSTGGSTGMPLQYLSDMQTWSVGWASIFRSWHWFGFSVGEKIFTIGGHSLVSKKRIFTKKNIFEKWLMRNYKYSSSEMKPEDMARHYKRFIAFKPVAIRGYASTLYVFAKYIEDNKLPVLPIHAIFTTGEVLLPNYRSKVQEVFKAPIYDSYGAGDGGIATHECYMHEGLHISEEKCILEIIDKNGEIVEDGTIGNVITTDLDNYAFPFIRYNVGDMSYIKKEYCSCGRKSKLLGVVMGRSGRLLYSKSGVPISPTMLPVLLYPDLNYDSIENQALYNKIDKFQIRQDKNGDLLILLKVKESRDESLKLFGFIIENYTKYFPGSKVELEFVKEIPPLPSGKEDYILSDFLYNN